jgi:hypothetical protein
MKEIDYNDEMGAEDGEAGYFYSSRHHVYAKRIGRWWRARQKGKTVDNLERAMCKTFLNNGESPNKTAVKHIINHPRE